MRRHGFVESKACGVTGTRHNTQSHRTDSGTELGDFRRVLQVFHEDVDHTAGAQTGGKHTGSDDQTDDAAVAVAHTVEELLDQFGRVRTRNDQGIDETEQHGGGHAHLHTREPESDDEQKHNRKQRGKSPEHVRVFRQFNIALVNAVIFETALFEVTEDQAGDRQENNTNDGNQKRAETRIGNEVHHGPFGELGNETVVRRTRRPERRQRRADHRSSSHGRTETGTDHQSNDRRTDSGAHTREGRNGQRGNARHDHAAGQQQKP